MTVSRVVGRLALLSGWSTTQAWGALAAWSAGGVWLLWPGSVFAWGLLVAAAAALSFLAPAWSLALLAFTAPFERPLLLGGFTVYSTELLLVTFLPSALCLLGRRPGWQRGAAPVEVWIAPFLLVLLASAFAAHSPAAVKGTLRWLEFFLALGLGVHWLRRGHEAERVLWALVLAAVLSAGWGLAQTLGGPGAHPELQNLILCGRGVTRAAAGYGANTLALLLVLVLPFLWAAAQEHPNIFRRRLAVWASALLLLGLIPTLSLTGVLALFAAVSLVWFVAQRPAGGLKLVAISAGMVLILLAFSWIAKEFWYYKLASLNDRLGYFHVVVRLFRTAPILGIGPGLYRLVAPAFGPGVNSIGLKTHPHSLYLLVLAELGVTGLAALVWALVSAARFLLQRAQRLPAGWPRSAAWAALTGLVSFAFGNLTEHALVHDRGVHAALFLAAALVLARRPATPRFPEPRTRFERAWQDEPPRRGAEAWQAELQTRRLDRAPLYQLLDQALQGRSQAAVLELGCGTALDALSLAGRPNCEVHGVDFSERALQAARNAAQALGRQLHLQRADVRHTPFPDGKFDLVFSQGLLEHFPDSNPVWAEMARLLAPNGCVVVDVPQTWNPYTLAKAWHRLRGDWPWGWETQYTRWTLAAAGRAHGLRPLAVRGYGYRGGPLDVFSWLRAALAPKFPKLWRAWESRCGACWMMNVVMLFQKPR